MQVYFSIISSIENMKKFTNRPNFISNITGSKQIGLILIGLQYLSFGRIKKLFCKGLYDRKLKLPKKPAI